MEAIADINVSWARANKWANDVYQDAVRNFPIVFCKIEVVEDIWGR